jgi:hypothetical protein
VKEELGIGRTRATSVNVDFPKAFHQKQVKAAMFVSLCWYRCGRNILFGQLCQGALVRMGRAYEDRQLARVTAVGPVRGIYGIYGFASDDVHRHGCMESLPTSDPAIVLWQAAGSPRAEEVSFVAESFSAFLDMLMPPEERDF